MKNFTEELAYRFMKVEDYFEGYQEWAKLDKVEQYEFDKLGKALSLEFTRNDGKSCRLLLQIPTKNTIRFRFNPDKMIYSDINSRKIVQDKFSNLMAVLNSKEPFTVEAKTADNKIIVLTRNNGKAPVMQVSVQFNPFSILVYRFDEQKKPFLIWETANAPIYYTPNGKNDYAIIQAVKKPASARYIGFGEHGGESLSKNSTQSNFFNFDNMKYSQVYNQGALDSREPLYHSDPFFMEFNAVPEQNSVNGIFIDNMGQILVDTGYINSNRYMFGTRFGDLDFFLFTGSDPKEILISFTNMVGKSRLKPRYCLGYQQGCYGYEDRGALEWVVERYRSYGIPLDGLHIDVDLQENYKTFTINTNKFPGPEEMFRNLRKNGIKCSTNITPIISNQKTENYQTYKEAATNDYFIKDKRYDPENPVSKKYQDYGGGNEYQPNNNDFIEGFNSGNPFIGEVYYGNNFAGEELGTKGHYADLGRKEVRKWWGRQYQYLFDTGLEMVWQDMTTPAIRACRGDMKGFPFRLLLTDDSASGEKTTVSSAIKIWNLYSYNLHKATFHGLNNLKGRDNKRNFIIGRGSFTGSHRWAGLWTGDNSSDWNFLKINVSQVLSLGMCGVDLCGQDIGGFEARNPEEKWADPELLIRWTIAGAFLPWFRNHYVRKGRKEFQEPFMYVEWFNQYRGGMLPEPAQLYRNVLPICKYYIRLRYKLMQLFYDTMFSNTIDGIPICRPLFLNDPDDKSLYNDKLEFLDNEFFVGKDLLVAPILSPESEDRNMGRRDVYLPDGSNWYCFVNDTMPLSTYVEGGTTVRDFDANLNILGLHIAFMVPIFVRAGAIIPTIEMESYVGELNEQGKPNPITLNIYPGASGEYTMYLDDGVSRSSAPRSLEDVEVGGDKQAKSEYREVQISHFMKNHTREIIIERIHDGYTPNYETYFFVALLHDPNERKTETGCLKRVVLNGVELKQITNGIVDLRRSELCSLDCDGWYYDDNINISYIKVMDKNISSKLAVEYFQ